MKKTRYIKLKCKYSGSNDYFIVRMSSDKRYKDVISKKNGVIIYDPLGSCKGEKTTLEEWVHRERIPMTEEELFLEML